MIVSLMHVVSFWNVTNPFGWAVFLSIAIEIGVLSSIAASRISNWAWLPFSLVTFIQIIGNIFYSYVQVDITGHLFKMWVELTDPFFNFIGFGTDGDIIVHRRIVAMFGAAVPLIAMLFFNFFIRETRKTVPEPVAPPVAPPTAPPQDIWLGTPDYNTPVHIETLPQEPEITANAVKNEPEPVIEPVIEPQQAEITANAVKEAQVPTEADKAIENMMNIPQEKLQEPYFTPFTDITELPHINAPEIANIESVPFEPQATTPDELPMIAADVAPSPTLEEKWTQTGILNDLTSAPEESPVVQVLTPDPVQVIEEPEKKK